MRSLVGRPDVRLLLAGQTLSMFGDWAMIIVLGIWARVLTGSNAAAGLVFFTFALAGLLAPVGGLVVDRVHKRPLMIATHVLLAGVVCLLLLVHDPADMWLLYAVTLLYGLGGDVFGAARSAMLKAMLPDEQLADANGALQSVREGLRLVAPPAGAGLYAAFGGRRSRSSTPRASCSRPRRSSSCPSSSPPPLRASTGCCARSRRGSCTSRARGCSAS